MRVLIIAVIMLCYSLIQAQNNNSYVSLRSGISIPVGDYGSTNLQDGCFTLPGFNTGIEGAWFFRQHLGIGAQIGFTLNPVDVSSLGYEKVKDDEFLLDLTIRSDPYQIITGAVGGFLQWDFGKRISLNGKLLGGIMFAKTPYQLYKPTYYLVEPKYFEITSARDNNLMGIAGVGIRFSISPCISISIEEEYQYSSMVFGYNSATGIRYDHRNIATISTLFGLVIIL
jgi:hypothetical protein